MFLSNFNKNYREFQQKLQRELNTSVDASEIMWLLILFNLTVDEDILDSLTCMFIKPFLQLPMLAKILNSPNKY